VGKEELGSSLQMIDSDWGYFMVTAGKISFQEPPLSVIDHNLPLPFDQRIVA
jgi:hypothetical protein